MTITGILTTISAEFEHNHEEHADFWVEFFGLLTNPAHIAFEFVFSLVFDFLIVGLVVQKIIIPRLRKTLHEEIDREHGVEHKEDPKDSSPKK
jgi:hypothetical protein